ncbi:MAG: glycosyltransferase family 39 protein [Thermodesulfobacteriota bacterium]
MIAENYYRTDWNILYPEVNWSGRGPNYQGREFQTVSFAAAGLYVLLGQQDWIGRLISVVFGLWGIFALYKLVSLLWDKDRALVSAMVMAVLPGSIFIERSFIPDPAMVSLVVTSLWMFVLYLQTGRQRYVIGSALIGTWGFLTKITGLIVGLPMVYAIFSVPKRDEKLTLKRVATIILIFSLSLISVASYYLWAKHLSDKYPPHVFAGEGNWLWDRGITEWAGQGYFVSKLIQRLIWLWSLPAFILVLFSFIINLTPARQVFGNRNFSWFFHWWFFAGIIYYLLGAVELIGNPWNFHIINPAAAALASDSIVKISSINSRSIWSPSSSFIIIPIIILIVIFGRRDLNQSYTPYAQNGYKLGLALRHIAQPHDLIVTIPDSYGDPVAIYYSQRRGWVFPPAGNRDWGKLPDDDGESIRLFEEIREKDARWFGIVNHRKKDIWDKHPKFAEYIQSKTELHTETPEYSIYRILTRKELGKKSSID